jgi:hypothetical protein
MEISVASMRISREITKVEAALNEALIAQADLYGQLLRARKETESDPFLGHRELLHLMKAQQSLLSSSGDLARVHGGLSDLQQEFAGIRPCPPSGALTEAADESAAA